MEKKQRNLRKFIVYAKKIRSAVRAITSDVLLWKFVVFITFFVLLNGFNGFNSLFCVLLFCLLKHLLGTNFDATYLRNSLHIVQKNN